MDGRWIKKQLSTATAVNLLPVILQTIQLRRVKGEVIRLNAGNVIIRAAIPPYTVTTAELEMSAAEAQRYAVIHLKALSAGCKGGAAMCEVSGVKGGTMDMRAHRRLCHAVVHTGLDNFLKVKRVTTAKIATWNDRADYRYSYSHRLNINFQKLKSQMQKCPTA